MMEEHSLSVVTYRSVTASESGIAIWRVMVHELWQYRDLVYRLMARDISVRYRQAILGYAWAIILPLITVALFTFLSERRILPLAGVALPYPVFALWNMVIWQLFAGILTNCTASLVNAGPLISRINFPKESLLLAAIGQPIFEFIIKLVAVVAISAWFGVTFSWNTVLVIPALVPMVLLGAGMGFFLSIANLAARDFSSIVGMAVMLGMFVTPVLYPPPISYPFFLINLLNPASPLLIATQDLLAFGELRHADIFWAATLFAISTFLIGWRIFRVAMPRVAERA